MYYYNPKKYEKAAYGVSMYVIVRSCIRLCDFENTRPFGDEREWFSKVVSQSGNLLVHTTVFFQCSPATAKHLFLTMMLLALEVFTVMCGIYTSKLLIQDPGSFFEKSGFMIL